MLKPHVVLLVEDNPADVYLVREAIRAHDLKIDLHVLEDGEAAIQFIDAADGNDDSPCPELALLDINLPKRSGLEVLARLRKSTKCGNIPVAILSSSRKTLPLNESSLVADYFFTKPSDYDRFMRLGVIMKSLLQES